MHDPVGGRLLYTFKQYRQIFSNAQSRTKAIRNPPDEVHDFRLHPGKMLPASHTPVAEYIIVPSGYIIFVLIAYSMLYLSYYVILKLISDHALEQF